MMTPHTVDITRYTIGILVLALVLIPIASFLLPRVKGKFPTLKWPKIGWVNGRMLLAFAIGIILTLTVREFWRPEWNKFFIDHGQYAWLVVITSNVLFCLLFGRQKSTGSGNAHSSSASGHGSPSIGRMLVTVLFVACVFLAILGLAVAYVESRQPVATPGVSSLPKVVQLTITAKNGYWTLYKVEPGWNLFWSAKWPIQFRYGQNEEPRDDLPGSLIRLPPRVGPYTIWFTPGPTVSVDVPIDLTLTQM